MTVIIFLIVLAVLIFVHELGHFLCAKANGIRVDEFKLGFGPKLLAWTMGETEYGINIIPFGGYVKIFGENGELPENELVGRTLRGLSLVHKSPFQQIVVLVAGVVFNFVFAWLLYAIVFYAGVTATTDGFEQYASRFKNERIMITYVEPGSPAEKAGLALGDVFTGIVFHGAEIPATSTIEVQNLINQSNGVPFNLVYARQGHELIATIAATSSIVAGKYAVGIGMSNVVDLQLPVYTSVSEAFRYTLSMIRDTAVGLYTFVAHIFEGTANFADVSGPVGIAGIVGNAASLGFTYLLMVTALISINLGVINLIPFPALDGGRVLFVILEGIFHRRIPAKFTNTINAIGFILLMILMLAVTYKDIAKLVQ